jgi:hypothetical protein
MTLLTVTREVCAAVGVSLPTSVFSGINANRTMQEMLALANEMVQRIGYDTRDWTGLTEIQTFTGNGTVTAFPMPANFKRMLKTSEVWRSDSMSAPMRFIADPDEWLQRRMRVHADTRGEWTIQKKTMLIYPAMAAGVTANFMYLSRNLVQLSSGGGGVGDVFMADNDTGILDERMLKLGMIWQWKANKGAPYAEDMGSYSDALTNNMGSDRPAPTFVGHAPISAAAKVAIPWPASWGPQP